MYLFPPITNKRQMKPLIMKRDPKFLNDLPLSPPSVYTHYGEQGKYLPQPELEPPDPHGREKQLPQVVL